MTEKKNSQKVNRPIDLTDEEMQIELAAAALVNDVVASLHVAKEGSGISQREIARRLGVGEARVSQVLSGEGDLRLSTLGRYLAAMGFRLEVELKPLEERRRRRRKKPQQSVDTRSHYLELKADMAVWHHSVVSTIGIHSAFVVAPDMEPALDVIHHTGKLVFAPDDLLTHDHVPTEAIVPVVRVAPWDTQWDASKRPTASPTAIVKVNTNAYS